MKKELHDIDKLFRDSIDEHLEFPPPGVWDEVQKKLDEELPEEKRRPFLWRYWAAAACLLLLCGGVFALFEHYALFHGDVPVTVKTPVPAHREGNENPLKEARPATALHSANDATLKTVIAAPLSHDSVSILHRSGPSATTLDADLKEKAAETVVHSPQPKRGYSLNEATPHQENTQPVDRSAITSNRIKLNKQDNTHAAAESMTANERASKAHLPVDKRRSTITENLQMTAKTGADSRNRKAASIATNRMPVTISLDLLRSSARLTNDPTVTTNTALTKPAKATGNPMNRFSVTAFVTPATTNSDIRDGDPSAPPRPGARPDDLRKTEHNATTVQTGVLLHYDLSKKFTIGSGIYVQSSHEDIGPKRIYAEHDDLGHIRYRFNCSNGYSYIDPGPGMTPVAGDSIVSAPSSTSTRYLSIPLSLAYNFNLGRFTFSPTVGVAANFLSKGQLTTATASTNGKETASVVSGLRSSYFSGALGLSVRFQATEHFGLVFEPNYQLALSASTQNLPINTYPKSTGYLFGAYFRL